MQLLKHLSLDIGKFSSLQILEPHDEQFEMIFIGDHIGVWSCPIDSRDYDLSQLCNEDDEDIEMTKVGEIHLPSIVDVIYSTTQNPLSYN